MNFGRILWRFQTRNQSIMRLVNDAISMQAQRPDHAKGLIGIAVVKLLDEWSLRCRTLIIASAQGGSYSRTGRKISGSSIWRPEGSPIAFLRQNWGTKPMSRSWEPKWHAPNEAIRAASLLQIPNLAEIQNGLGASVSADDLRVTRNLVAHNLPNTWQQFQVVHQRNGIGARTNPEDFVLMRVNITGPRFIELWTSDLEGAFAAAAV
jgi:hypothetical protein